MVLVEPVEEGLPDRSCGCKRMEPLSMMVRLEDSRRDDLSLSFSLYLSVSLISPFSNQLLGFPLADSNQDTKYKGYKV